MPDREDGLLPEWAAPGATIYRTLLEEARRDSVDMATLVVFVPLACRSEFYALAGEMLSRLYVRGVATGYEQAAIRLDVTRPTPPPEPPTT